MKKIILSAAVLAMGASAFAAAIEQVIVRQQWPWSTDIKVEYKLSGVTAPVDLTVTAYNGSTELVLPKAAIKGDLYGISEDGVGQIVIDPVAAFGTEKIALANFKVKLTVADAPESAEVLYRIYNISNGKCTDITRAEILNGKYGAYETDYAKIGDGFSTPLEDVLIWTGVTNYPGIYTTNIVMRKISAKDKVWLMGDNTNEVGFIQNKTSRQVPQRHTQLSQDFYIGVFELTQYQYKKMDQYGTPGYLHTDDASLRYPADGIYRYRLHSHPTGVTGKGLVHADEVVAWPTNSYLHDVGSSTALAWLRNKTGVEFDIPTAAQWEFACRAGTTGALYSGKSQSEANVGELGWNSSNAGSTTHLGGQKAPNAFGLYDMLGNVNEYVQNFLSTYESPTSGDGKSESTPLVDPKGSANVAKVTQGQNRGVMGGSYNGDRPGTWHDLRSAMFAAYYDWTAGGSTYSHLGVRLVCPVTAQWSAHD